VRVIMGENGSGLAHDKYSITRVQVHWLTEEKCNQTKSIRKIRRMAYHLIPLSKCVNSERAVSISRWLKKLM